MARSGDLNIFLEISNLSGLSMGMMKPQGLTDDVLSNIDDTNQQSMSNKNIVNPVTNCMEPDSRSVLSQENISTVIDRSSSGNIRKVSYIFNENTKNVNSLLEQHKIPYETELYKPREQRQTVSSNIFYCKNLFLKDRKGQFYLVICHEEYNIDLKQLRKTLNANRNFNFGTADDMKEILGTEPGGVTPLALMNPTAANVKMVIHKSLTKEDSSLMFHPLDLKLATKITLPSLLRYLKSCNHTVTFVK